MGNPIQIMMTGAAVGAALLVTACGGGADPAEDRAANVLEPDAMYEAGNDITAIDGAADNAADADGNGLRNALENAAEATGNAAAAIDNAQQEAR